MGELDKLIEERYITTTQASKIWGIHKDTINRWCRSGYIGAKIGGRYIVDKIDLESISKKRGNPNFHDKEYQDNFARQRRDDRISSQEAAEALDSRVKDTEPVTGGIMMGRKRR